MAHIVVAAHDSISMPGGSVNISLALSALQHSRVSSRLLQARAAYAGMTAMRRRTGKRAAVGLRHHLRRRKDLGYRQRLSSYGGARQKKASAKASRHGGVA